MSWCWMVAIHTSENVPDGMTIQQGVNSGVSERMKQVTFSAGGDSERPWPHDSACKPGDCTQVRDKEDSHMMGLRENPASEVAEDEIAAISVTLEITKIWRRKIRERDATCELNGLSDAEDVEMDPEQRDGIDDGATIGTDWKVKGWAPEHSDRERKERP